MTGPPKNVYEERGLLSRTTSYIFNATRSEVNGGTLSVRISAIEIYNEVLTDLLRELSNSSDTSTAPTSSNSTSSVPKLSIIETPTGIVVPALYIMPVSTEEDVQVVSITNV